MLNTGTILPINRELGLYWLLLAGQQGDLDAQRLLGAEFVRRTSETEDPEQISELNTNAIFWLRQADQQGDIESKSLLGKLLVQHDDTRAEGLALIEDAARLGSENAKNALRLIEEVVDEKKLPE